MNNKNLRKIVKGYCKDDSWEYHIVPVTKYAKMLAKSLGSNVELAESAALLHDIGRLRFGPEKHETTGVPETERILNELNYPKETIDEIKHCVESHRASINTKPKTITAKIIANADAMAHFDTVPGLIIVASSKLNKNTEDSVKWVYDKLKRDWKKLTLPEARKMMENKYKAAILILESMMEYF